MKDEQFHTAMMRRALALARRGMGRTSPNPAVGCVIVRDGEVVGEGWHEKAGEPHAEIHALMAAGREASGSDLYVTLEPCCHFGRTPPCTNAIISAGVFRVFVGMIDPNPKVSGEGIARLRSAGIEVESGLLEPECIAINRPFIKHVTTGMPFVTLKSAMTLDGKTATSNGDSRWVTGEPARRHVHAVRGNSDAVMVGVGTVIADDPQLTCRVEGGRDPHRVIVDSTLRIPADAKLFSLESTARTIVATVSPDDEKVRELQSLGAEVITCNADNGRVDLQDLMAKLGQRGVQSVLLEGGATLAGAMIRNKLIDNCLFFFAPKLVAGDGIGLFEGRGAVVMGDAISLDNVKVRNCGIDILIEGDPVY